MLSSKLQSLKLRDRKGNEVYYDVNSNMLLSKIAGIEKDRLGASNLTMHLFYQGEELDQSKTIDQLRLPKNVTIKYIFMHSRYYQ